MDETFFVVSPLVNDAIKNVVRVRPGYEEWPKAIAYGELAVVLEQLGYKDTARENYLIASRLMNIPEEKAREIFECAIKERKAQGD